MSKRNQRKDRQLRLITGNAPFHFQEAFKSLRTNLDYITSSNNYRSVVITSVDSCDGKSTIAINLAMAMAESGKRVILVDCDLRKGYVANYLNIGRRTPGIINVLADKVSLDSVIQHNEQIGADVLTVGPQPTNPSEILGSPAMVQIIQELTERYELVLIDTPPVSVLTDAAILSRFADGVLLVVRADYDTKQALALSKNNLENVNAKILGVVLNDYNIRSKPYRKNYYAYAKGYKQYGGK